jgi:hypothetical protein
MGNFSFRLVPKMVARNIMTIYIVMSNGENCQIAEIHFPNDNQQNDNLEAAQAICDVLKKRIRKSI